VLSASMMDQRGEIMRDCNAGWFVGVLRLVAFKIPPRWHNVASEWAWLAKHGFRYLSFWTDARAEFKPQLQKLPPVTRDATVTAAH